MSVKAALVVVVVATAVAVAPVASHAEPGAGIDEARARDCFAEMRRLAAADNGALWGKILGGPILFVDRASRSAVASEADGESRLVPHAGVFVGKIPNDVIVANTALEWAGKRWTELMWPLPRNRYARDRLLMHELYHRVQPALGLPAASPQNPHLDTVVGRTWLQLEWRALAEALVRRGEARRAASLDALVFRARRRQIAGAGAAESERALELNEGLAEYTGYRLCGLPAEVLPDRVATRLDSAPTDGLSRGFAYLSGPAYGLLLDAVSPRWRSRVKPTSDLGALLATALGATLAADLETQAASRAGKYDGAALIAEESERENERLARLAAYRKDLVYGKVLRLPLGATVSYSFDPNGIESFDESSSVYTTTRITESWGVLEVDGGAALIRRDGDQLVEVVVAAPERTADGAKGPSWTLKLAPGHALVPGPRPGDLAANR